MKLTQEQIASYDENGYLLLPGCFSPAEVDALRAELPALFAEDSPRRVVEKDGGAVRSVYGSHASNEVFRRLARHPRLVEPAAQMLGSPVYVYQFKINAKLAFLGDVWEWHQDYIFWLQEDRLPEARLVTISLFLDEVHEFNGPLIFIPGSHKEGILESLHDEGVPDEYADSPDWISNLTADLKYSVSQQAIARLAAKNGMAAPKGPPGSALFFHPNLVHASVSNISPFDRRIVLVTYSSVDNVPVVDERSRPEFLVSRDFTPIAPLPDDALLQPA
jgi:L-proline 4-hydroxylase